MKLRLPSIKCEKSRLSTSIPPMLRYLSQISIFILLFSSISSQSTQSGYLFGLKDESCKGIPLTSSKYCSGFSGAFLAPTNIVPGLLYLLNYREDDQDAAKPFIQARYDQLSTVNDFDNVFRDIILPNAFVIAGRQTSCPYKNYGLVGLITYSCQWLVNYGVIYPSPQNWYQSSCLLQSAQTRPPGLCLTTTTDFVASAQNNFDKDPSCNPSLKSDMLSRSNAYVQSSRNLTNRNDASNSCISWQNNESKLNLCGYVTQTQACLNSCKIPNVDCTQVLKGYVMQTDTTTTSQSSSSTTTAIQIVVVVVGFLVALGCGGYLFYHQKKKGNIPSSFQEALAKFKKPSALKKPTIPVWKTPLAKAEDSVTPQADFLKTRGLGEEETPAPPSSAPKLSLPLLNISSVSSFLSESSPKMGPAASSKMDSLYDINSSTISPSIFNPPTLNKPKSALSQPPLTMSNAGQKDLSSEEDIDNDVPLSMLTLKRENAATLKSSNPALAVLPPSKAILTPSTSSSLHRSSLSSVPLPRHIPSTIGSVIAPPVTAQPPPTSTMISTTSDTQNTNQSRTQSLISVNTTDSILFRRETLLRAGSMMSEAVLVKYDFEPDRSDEVPLKPGDKVVVITRYEDGWGWGCKYDPKTGKEQIGAFPLNCLEDFYASKK